MWIAWKSCLFVQRGHSIQMNCRRICLHRHNKPTMVCGDVWYSCKDLKKLYLTIVVGVFYVAPVFYLPDPFKHAMFFNVDMGQRSIWSNLVESSTERSSLQQVLFGIKLLLIFPWIHTGFCFRPGISFPGFPFWVQNWRNLVSIVSISRNLSISYHGVSWCCQSIKIWRKCQGKFDWFTWSCGLHQRGVEHNGEC